MATEERPDGDFRELSVYPTEADMRQVVSLRKHITSGGLMLYKYKRLITSNYKQELLVRKADFKLDHGSNYLCPLISH